MSKLKDDCDACERLAPEKLARILRATLASIDGWRERAIEIAEAAVPATGNRARALSLAKDMELARLALRRIAGMEADDGPEKS